MRSVVYVPSRPALRHPALALALALALACSGVLGTPMEQMESSYDGRVSDYQTAIQGLPADQQPAATEALRAYTDRYAALPTDEAAREEQLGKLNQDMRAAIEALQPAVDANAAAQQAEIDAHSAEKQKALVGHWSGGGVTLDIDENGQLAYKKVSGATSSELNGPISSVTDTSFKMGMLGIYTTFHIDQAPHDDGGATKMTLDGVELTRSP